VAFATKQQAGANHQLALVIAVAVGEVTKDGKGGAGHDEQHHPRLPPVTLGPLRAEIEEDARDDE
jgi:hypothetical protein